jgi:hypothetical protein
VLRLLLNHRASSIVDMNYTFALLPGMGH